MIIARYLVTEYLKPFVFCLVLISVLVIASQFFEKLNLYLTMKTSITDIVIYTLTRSPLWILQTLPIATLLGTLFSLNKLSRQGEITALKSAGVNLYHALIPLILTGIIISMSSFFLFEYFAPYTNRKSDYIYRVKIRKWSSSIWSQENMVMLGKDGRFYAAKVFDPGKNLLLDISVDKYNTKYQIIQQIFAKQAKWQPETNSWLFEDGIIRSLSPSQEPVREEKFSQRRFNLPEKPQDFIKSEKKSEEMNYRELYNYVLQLRTKGIPARKEIIQYHLKFAYPFANLALLFIGIPFGLSTSRSARMQSFGICIASTFFYWGILSVGRAMGENYYLPTWLSAWSANSIFILLGIFIWHKIKR